MAKNNEKFEPNKYYVNEEKQSVTYAVMAHGILFVGTAKARGGDAFDVERGQAIAHIKANIAQRKYDLSLTRQFIAILKDGEKFASYENGGHASPHFMHALQAATEEMKAQLAHIRDLKARLAAYTE
jgi:hypothetical protein